MCERWVRQETPLLGKQPPSNSCQPNRAATGRLEAARRATTVLAERSAQLAKLVGAAPAINGLEVSDFLKVSHRTFGSARPFIYAIACRGMAVKSA